MSNFNVANVPQLYIKAVDSVLTGNWEIIGFELAGDVAIVTIRYDGLDDIGPAEIRAEINDFNSKQQGLMEYKFVRSDWEDYVFTITCMGVK